jgi:hypothetical protein
LCCWSSDRIKVLEIHLELGEHLSFIFFLIVGVECDFTFV